MILQRTRIAQNRSDAGFNMVEVTLALGVVAVALVVILGLMPSGLNASRRVADETTITTLVADMLHWRRITPYDKSPWVPEGAPNLTVHDFLTNLYFDVNGNPPTLRGTNLPNPLYIAPYYRFNYAVTNHPDIVAFSNSPDVALVVITVEWPLNPGNSNLITGANKRTFFGEYSRTQ